MPDLHTTFLIVGAGPFGLAMAAEAHELGERDTLERFLKDREQRPSDVEPISLDLYLEYAAWFEQVKGIRARPSRVTRLDHQDRRFAATLEDGSVITADDVLLAIGFAPFAHVPGEGARRALLGGGAAAAGALARTACASPRHHHSPRHARRRLETHHNGVARAS